jgi:chromosome segregation ATPase
MTLFSVLVHRVAAEAERQLRGGVAALAKLVDDRERSAERERLRVYGERLARLEETLKGQDAGMRELRTELDSLVTQLNERLLPRIDERMDDTERDLTVVATTLVRTGKDTAGNSTRLENVEQRVSDLRGKLSQMEQRAGLWRELQGNMARLGDDIDALRGHLEIPAAEPLSGQEAHH